MSTRQQEAIAVDRFAGMMLQRLAENRHKTYWRHGPPMLRDLWALLKGESDELATAITANEQDSLGARFAEIRCEAADVANFAMMVYDLTLTEAVGDK